MSKLAPAPLSNQTMVTKMQNGHAGRVYSMHMQSMYPHTCQRHDCKVLRCAVCPAAQRGKKCPPGWPDSIPLQQGPQLAPI